MFQKLVEKIDYKISPLVHIDNSNRSSFIDYVWKKNSNVNRPGYSMFGDNYSMFCLEHEANIVFYISIAVMLLMTECLLLYILLYSYYRINRNNISIFKCYLSLKQILYLFLFPFLISQVTSLIEGILLSLPLAQLIYSQMSQSPPIFLLTLTETGIIIGINVIIILFIAGYLFIQIRGRKIGKRGK